MAQWGYLYSGKLVNFAGPTYLTIESSLQSSNVADETLSSRVLAKIPIQSGYADLQTWQDVTFGWVWFFFGCQGW
jgi:hypothetical protein